MRFFCFFTYEYFRMKKLIALCITIFLTGNLICDAQEIVAMETQQKLFQFDANQLLLNIKTLSSDAFEGRETGTPGGIKAKDYIVNELEKLEVESLTPNFEQSFTFTARQKEYNGINILGEVNGTEYPKSYIVISAHYDHLGVRNGTIYNGADDDASGVSAVLAFAEYFKKNPPKHAILLVLFDAEELGLQGSRYFVDNTIIPIENIRLNLNMDMLSRSDKNELYVTGARDNETFVSIISEQKSTSDFKFVMGHDSKDGREDWTYSSDHGSFLKKGIPFLYFGVEDHEDYHKSTDDYENIQPDFYVLSVENIISVFESIDELKF